VLYHLPGPIDNNINISPVDEIGDLPENIDNCKVIFPEIANLLFLAFFVLLFR